MSDRATGRGAAAGSGNGRPSEALLDPWEAERLRAAAFRTFALGCLALLAGNGSLSFEEMEETAAQAAAGLAARNEVARPEHARRHGEELAGRLVAEMDAVVRRECEALAMWARGVREAMGGDPVPEQPGSSAGGGFGAGQGGDTGHIGDRAQAEFGNWLEKERPAAHAAEHEEAHGGSRAKEPDAGGPAATILPSTHIRRVDNGFYIRRADNGFSDLLVGQLLAMFDQAPKQRMDDDWRRCDAFTFPDPNVCGSDMALTDVRHRIAALLKDYSNHIGPDGGSGVLNFLGQMEKPNIFRYSPSAVQPEHFHAHADSWNTDSATRQISVIAYLNDVEEGGETVFPLWDLAVKPTAGTVLMFPSSFPFIHYATPPVSGPKIIMVTWLHWIGHTNYASYPLFD